MGTVYSVTGAIVVGGAIVKGAFRLWIWRIQRKIDKLKAKQSPSYRERGY